MIELRSALFAIYLSGATIAFSAVGSLWLVLGEAGARMVVRGWARAALFGLGVICGLRWRIEGAQHIPRGGGLIVANHQSMWETIALLVAVDRPVMIFKHELLRVPVYGWWGRRAGMIPVDRRAGPRAIKSLAAATAARIREGHQVIVFPEGTRIPFGARGPLQPGATAIYLNAGAPCTPALHDSGRLWLHPGGLFSLKRPGVVTLRFLPAIEPGLSRKTFQARLEIAMSARGEALDEALDETAAHPIEAAGEAQERPA
jgi:1-acyl-sn-glycerol-3-phosphate acyltransferase